MRVIIGVDDSKCYESSVYLLSWLEMNSPDVEVVHADESRILKSKNDFGYVSEFELAELDRQDSILEQAEQLAKKWGFPTTKKSLSGSATKLLVEHANKRKADLVCLGSRRRSKFNSSLFGSVGKALALSAHQSILICKSSLSHEGPLTVVVTTDHSDYSNKALRLLMKFKPVGIQRLILLTTFDSRSLRTTDSKQLSAAKKLIESRSKEVCDAMVKHRLPAEHRVVEGDLGVVVEELMEEAKADLLIMGSQGEGYSGTKVAIGSSALKQVVSSKHSILLLRP